MLEGAEYGSSLGAAVILFGRSDAKNEPKTHFRHQSKQQSRVESRTATTKTTTLKRQQQQQQKQQQQQQQKQQQQQQQQNNLKTIGQQHQH